MARGRTASDVHNAIVVDDDISVLGTLEYPMMRPADQGVSSVGENPSMRLLERTLGCHQP
jgi:hypothetical protein